MMRSYTLRTPKTVATVFGIVAVATVLSVQYPLSTRFPLGGDPPTFLYGARAVVEPWFLPEGESFSLLSSRHPLAVLFLAATKVLPVSWPERFIWAMAIAHIVGILVFLWVATRLVGRSEGLVGAAFWAASVGGVNAAFNDGTLAQLVSLPLFLLTIDAVRRRALGWSFVLALLVFFTHLFSFLVLVCLLGTLIITIRGPTWPSEDVRFVRRLVLPLAGIALTLVLLHRQLLARAVAGVLGDSTPSTLPELLGTNYGLVFLLALVGVPVLVARLRSDPLVRALVLALVVWATVLTFNHRLGIGIAPERFQVYFGLVAALAAGVALPALVRVAFVKPVVRGLAGVLLLAVPITGAFGHNARIFATYEGPRQQAHVPPEERLGYAWIAEHLPREAVIVTSSHRRTVWLSVLGERRRYRASPERPDAETFRRGDLAAIRAARSTSSATHILFYRLHEDVLPAYRDHPDEFPRIFENEALALYALRAP
ncbi:MAG: hypothetical protein Q8R32_01595 [bacterium]|nr:hypothetical protein [bacterium]